MFANQASSARSCTAYVCLSGRYSYNQGISPCRESGIIMPERFTASLSSLMTMLSVGISCKPSLGSVPSISEYFSIHTGCLRIPWRLLRVLLWVLMFPSLPVVQPLFIMPLYIFQTAPFDRHCRRVVCLTLHLVDVPVRLQVTQVTYTYIGTETFRFPGCTTRESIVVTIVKR